MIKKLIHGIGIMTICLFLFQSSVLAAEKSVTLTKVEDGAQVFVELPSQQTADSVNALQMELKVETLKGKAVTAKFEFNKAIKSSVKEYRYDEKTGRLTIYIAGKADLFSKKLLTDGKLELGKVAVSTTDELGAKVKISVAKNEYSYVTGNGTTLEKESVNAPGFVEVVLGNGGEVITPEEQKPGSEVKPNEGDGQEQNAGADDQKSENGSQHKPAGTGDAMQPMLYFLAAVVAAAIVVGVLLYRRKKNKKYS